MKIIVDYLKRDLGRTDLMSWEAIRRGYLERAAMLVADDWQSPSYLASLNSQAGRREGSIIGTINDYTRDQHDLALRYEKKFVSQYLPRVSILPIEAYVTSSGMAALTTAIVTLHRLHGTDQVVLLGKHSYFQNQEMILNSFTKVVVFDETNEGEWIRLIDVHKPRALFVDTLCNEPHLTEPPVEKMAQYLANSIHDQTYLVIDNSMLATQFNWRKVLAHRSRKLSIIGWESLNKYYQFGMDRTTGGIVWGSTITLSVKILQACRHAGTIMPDINVAMLPTPNKKVMNQYLAQIWRNRAILQNMVGSRGVGAGAQVVINFAKKQRFDQIQKLIKRVIVKGRRSNIQIVAGTSFGFPNTRLYLTARQSAHSEMFLRVSAGVEEAAEMKQLTEIIRDVLP